MTVDPNLAPALAASAAAVLMVMGGIGTKRLEWRRRPPRQREKTRSDGKGLPRNRS